MHLWEAGPLDPDTPVVLAIHGLGGSGRYWQGLADLIGETHRVMAPDLAGFGRSDEPDVDADRSLHLADLDAVMETAGGPNRSVQLVGHSLGGVLAALWALENRELTAALALAAPSYPTGQAMDFRSRADLRASSSRRAAGKAVRLLWPLLALPIGLARGYPITTVVDFGRQSVRSRAWTLWSLWSDPGLVTEIERVAELDAVVPTLLAHARDDRTVNMSAHHAWMRLLPHADEHVVDQGGHQFLLRHGFDPVASWLRTSSAAS